jgi:hypothetical protein
VSTGFGEYHSGGLESSFHLRELSRVFILTISAIFVALIQIRTRCSGRYFILTDSLSSLKVLQTRKVV